MGDTQPYQPLTRRDKVTVFIYRSGIVLSTLIIAAGALLLYMEKGVPQVFNWLLLGLQVSVGLSVVFIHLYIGKLHRQLKGLYVISLLALGGLYVLAGGIDVAAYLGRMPSGFLLLLPLSGCLGFVCAKEAFCFRLFEGYILSMLMPAFLVILASGAAPAQAASCGLNVTALGLLLFTFRKVFQPLHYDIGDKSAYM
jgi:uncharacterized integral membrane protein